jgi:hypothetical protein
MEIRVGHYKSKFGGSGNNGETAEIIKILGEDLGTSEIPAKKGYWRTDDKKLYSEIDLINNWEYLNTSIKEENKILPKLLFEGLNEVEENIENIVEEFKLPELGNKNNYEQQNINYVEIIESTPEQKFIFDILNKLSISKNNIQINKNDNVIDISLEIPLDFNFIKLKETINLFNLDINEVINFILLDNQLKNIIQNKMKDKIFELLSDKHIEESNNKKEEKIELINNIEDIQNKTKKLFTEEIQEIPKKEENISSDIDDRIKKLTQKISQKWL